MKLLIVLAVVACAVNSAYGGPAKAPRSRCLVKWEECMGESRRPTGEECDEEIVRKHQCVKPDTYNRGAPQKGDFDYVITRESKDEDHEEDVSRLKLKSQDKSNLEVGNRDRVSSGAEAIRQINHDGSASGSNSNRGGGGGSSRRNEQEMEADEEASRVKSSGRQSSQEQSGGARRNKQGGGDRRSGPAESRSRGKASEERYAEERRREDEDTSSRGSGGSGSSKGRAGGSSFMGMDKVTFDKGHEDVMKFGTASQMEMDKDDFHKKDSISHKKEEIMKRLPN